MEDIYKFLEEHGFKDITEAEPIKFSECIPVTFDNIYCLHKRFKRYKNGITTKLLIGNVHNCVQIIIDSYFNGYWNRCFIDSSNKVIINMLPSYIKANETKLKTEYENSINHSFDNRLAKIN